MISSKKIIIVIAVCMLLAGSIPAVNIISEANKSQANELITSSSTLYIYSDYTFTGNIYESISVQADDIVIDGNGYSLQGSGAGKGIEMAGRDNVTIKNIQITAWQYGVSLIASSRISIINNNVIENIEYGIYVLWSSNNVISGNNVTDNVWGIMLQSNSNNNNVTGNNVMDNYHGITLNGFYQTLYNNRIAGNSIKANYWGIEVTYSSNNIISENCITNNNMGLRFLTSSDNIIYHNNIIDNVIQGSDANAVENNWHHPDLLEGNYWSDYPGVDDGSGTGKHAVAGDGIGDTDIPWPSMDYDYYPFTSETGWKPTICEDLEILKQIVIDSAESAWRKPAENRKNTMTNKIDEAIELCQNEEYTDCYDKVLHDIKPKLTGLKIDEEGINFGNGVFKNPWVIDSNLQQEFAEAIDSILSSLKSQ